MPTLRSMIPAASRARAFFLLAALAVPTAKGAVAQEVRGRLVADPGGLPLAGGYVVLLDAEGAQAGRAITNATGFFTLRAPAAGSYTVRGDHIGYRTAEVGVRVEAGGTATVELRTGVQAIELEGLVAEVDRECRVPEDQARRVAGLWEEVSKAFLVTAFVQEEGVLFFEWDRWQRRLEPRSLTVLEERRRAQRSMGRGSPFVSLPAERLAEEGYIHAEAGGGHRYYAPDARVLLSRSFQDTHCFGFTDRPPRDGEPSWVGILFEPRGRERLDIAGTLWIDRNSYEPQRLDFRYDRLPYPLVTDRVGGRIEFQRVPEGPWIVHRWRVRVPVAQSRAFRVRAGDPTEVRYELVAVQEDGGEVTRMRAGDGISRILARLGRVEGTVRETTGAPLAGATVTLEGTRFRDTADEEGRFVLPGVPEGVYRLTWTSPALAALDLPGESREVHVDPGETVSVDAVLAPSGVVLAERCPQPAVDEGTGVLRGRVTAPEGALPENTLVHVAWETVGSIRSVRTVSRTDGTPASGSLVHQHHHAAAIPVSERGAWMACGLPDNESLTVWVQVGEDASGTRKGSATELTLRLGEIRTLDLELAPARP